VNAKAWLLPVSVLVIAGLACSLGAASPTAEPDYAATITAQAEELAARTPVPSPTGETSTATASPTDTPTISAANPAPPSAPGATTSPKPSKTARPTSTATNTAQPTLSVPREPANLAGTTTSCTLDASASDLIWTQVVMLTWQDSDTETAYRLYRNGTPYTTVVTQDATSWPVSFRYPDDPAHDLEYDYFELEAYNSAGASSKASTYTYRRDCHR
jgi:hypothetical protein